MFLIPVGFVLLMVSQYRAIQTRNAIIRGV